MATSDSPLQMPARRFTSDEKSHRANNQALETFGNIAFYGFVPVGGVVQFLGTIAPPGYLELNGAAINRRAYKELFSIFGTDYGTGDGSTTFNLPTQTSPGGGIMIVRTGVY